MGMQSIVGVWGGRHHREPPLSVRVIDRRLKFDGVNTLSLFNAPATVRGQRDPGTPPRRADTFDRYTSPRSGRTVDAIRLTIESPQQGEARARAAPHDESLLARDEPINGAEIIPRSRPGTTLVPS